MKTKLLSLCLALLMGVSTWADDVWNCNIYDDCTKNGKTEDIRPIGQENGYTFVNLGLSVRWASCNVGATTPEEYGDYFAWGETETKDEYSWATYKYGNNKIHLFKYNIYDDKTTLESEDDAATVNWGGEWRMPTDAEWTELREQCTWTWTTQNGVNGYQVSSKTNGNSIFLPAAGYRKSYSGLLDASFSGKYWSASLNDSIPNFAWDLFFDSDSVGRDDDSRNNGRSVRPVCQSTSIPNTVVTIIPDTVVTITLYTSGCENASVIRSDSGQQVNITPVPENEHRHFVRWTDGNTDNPRLVTVTQDTTFTAEFTFNQYTVSTEVNDAERGSVSDDTTAVYLSEITLTAIANYGYHFARWTDWNTDNPRLVQVTGDATYTAVFAKNTYTITALSANTVQGSVAGDRRAEYLDQITLTAKPNFWYHFVRWTDGNTDNPRLVTVTQDTTFTAEFAQTFSGQCGYDLYWKYAGHTLTISGTGAMYDYNGNDMPWLLFRDTTDAVVLEQGITHIGNNAFNGFVKLGKIDLPSTLTSIGANAFAGCRKLYDTYAYPTEPPVADNSSFANYNVNLYVPCGNLRDYQMDAVFGSFKYIQCLGAGNTTTEGEITVTPSDNEAVFVWRKDGSANTYTLEIRKDNVVFCTLVFNASGQLTNIAFAPSRNGHPRHAAEQTGDGFRFTVTGLSKSTHYTFDMTVKDTDNATLQTYTGEFNTTGTATALDNTATDTTVQKIIRNGQVLILRGDKTYTPMGVEVNE